MNPKLIKAMCGVLLAVGATVSAYAGVNITMSCGATGADIEWCEKFAKEWA